MHSSNGPVQSGGAQDLETRADGKTARIEIDYHGVRAHFTTEDIVIVTVVWATQDVQDVVPVALEPGATVADAVGASGLTAQYGLDRQRVRYAIHGRRAGDDTPLAPGDRVEIVGPLIVDPKTARARRAKAGQKSMRRRGR